MPEEITPNLENTNDDASRIREEIRGHVHSGEVPTSPTEDVTDLVNRGWIVGSPPDDGKKYETKVVKDSRGREISLYKPRGIDPPESELDKKLPPESELDKKLAEGWVLGPAPNTEEYDEEVVADSNGDFVTIHKIKENVTVKSELEKKLEEGWVLGPAPNTEEYIEDVAWDRDNQVVTIHKGKPKISEVQQKLNEGWQIGEPPVDLPGSAYELGIFLDEYGQETPMYFLRGDTPPPPPPPYNPESLYTIIVGPSSSGKTVMLAGLTYFVRNSGKGNLVPFIHEDFGDELQIDGQALLDNLYSNVDEGRFPSATATRTYGDAMTSEMHLQFDPYAADQSSFLLTLVDTAGEHFQDLSKSVRLKEKLGFYLQEEINQRVIFILDPTDDEQIQLTRSIVNKFKALMSARDHLANRQVLYVVSKWDKVAEQYDNKVEIFLKQKHREIYNEVIASRSSKAVKFVEVVGFSIGVEFEDENFFTYKPQGILQIWQFLRNSHADLKRLQLANKFLSEESKASWIKRLIRR